MKPKINLLYSFRSLVISLLEGNDAIDPVDGSLVLGKQSRSVSLELVAHSRDHSPDLLCILSGSHRTGSQFDDLFNPIDKDLSQGVEAVSRILNLNLGVCQISLELSRSSPESPFDPFAATVQSVIRKVISVSVNRSDQERERTSPDPVVEVSVREVNNPGHDPFQFRK